MKHIKISIVFLMLALTALAQIGPARETFITGALPISTTIGSGGSAPVWTTLTSSNLISAGGSGQIAYITSDGTNYWYPGVPAETRKPHVPMLTIAAVRDASRSLSHAELAPTEYLTLAKSVGLTSAATDEARVLDVIDQIGLKVYDFGKVDEYLYGHALKQGAQAHWVWKPMREADLKEVQESGASLRVTKEGLVYPKQYSHKIPERVLLDVCNLLETMPDAVLLVSDYEVIKPDPFLAITTKKLLNEGKVWIVEQWDEPGFTEKGQPVQTVSDPTLSAMR